MRTPWYNAVICSLAVAGIIHPGGASGARGDFDDGPGPTGSDSERAELHLKTLVIPDRFYGRMQPQIFAAWNDSARHVALEVVPNFNFIVFNPFVQHPSGASPSNLRLQQRLMRKVVGSHRTLLKIKKKLKAGRSEVPESMVDAVRAFIRAHPRSQLAQARDLASQIMSGYTSQSGAKVLGFDYLILESTGTTVISPIYWDPDATDPKAFGATVDDLTDSTFDLLFLDVALEQEKPIYGTCHGAQWGYLYAGGQVRKVFDVASDLAKRLQRQSEKGGPINQRATYLRANPHGGPYERWRVTGFLNGRIGRYDMGFLKYPLPDVMQTPGQATMFINKDYAQTLAMLTPAPESISTFTTHPLSSLLLDGTDPYAVPLGREGEIYPSGDFNRYPNVTAETYWNFSALVVDYAAMRRDVGGHEIVDFYMYRTMIGSQYHPQKTYDDYDTARFVDYLVEAAVEQTLRLGNTRPRPSRKQVEDSRVIDLWGTYDESGEYGDDSK